MRHILLSIGLLSGAIIGAGMFALPFVFYTAGFAAGFFVLAVGACVLTGIHLMYAEVILNTRGEHRFVGYTRIYLGESAARFAMLMMIITELFVLAIYMILAKDFFGLLLPAGYSWLAFVLFWTFGSLFIFIRDSRLALTEFLITGGMIAIIAIIFLIGFPKVQLSFLPLFNSDISSWFLPFGPVLFALFGTVAVPSVVRYLQKIYPTNGRLVRTARMAIVLGTFVSASAYALFVLGSLGLSSAPSEDAVSGFIGSVHPLVLFGVGILGILSLWSSYIIVGLDVRNIILYDLAFSRVGAAGIVVLSPLIVYVASSQDFIGLISFVGGVFLAVEGLFLIFIWKRCGGRGTKDLFITRGRRFIFLISGIIFFGALISSLLL